jgi:carbamoylphosphate synthase large subunit
LVRTVAINERALHVVSPESLRTWLRYFVHDPGGLDRIQHVSDDPQLSLGRLLRRLEAIDARVAVFHSSHETLLRDCALARQLRGRSYAAFAQSPEAARLGVDKFLMRRFFQAHGLSALPWWRRETLGEAADDPMVVVKARSGTQSVGTRLARLRTAALAADEFCELYADGTEYSILVYRDGAGDAVLPPVWKGPTSPDLVPPWRRLRLCPDPLGGSELDTRLREWGLRTAVAARVCGWVEVELLVTGDGAVHVLEINPRVSGTMRIAALATGVRPFSLHREPALRGNLDAVARAAEVPYTGPAIADPARAMFGTSRLTVAAARYGELVQMLGTAADAQARAVLAPLVSTEEIDRSVVVAGDTR